LPPASTTPPVATTPPPPVDSGAPASGATGTYYGACLSELAFDQVKKVFSFYVVTTGAIADAAPGDTLALEATALKLESAGPPAEVSKAGEVGAATSAPAVAYTQPTEQYALQLGTVTIPGAANPISGSDVVISNTGLLVDVRAGQQRFCARMYGHVDAPAAAARTLDPAQNVCQFVPITDGAPTPTFSLGDFAAAGCP
jgi:hypothetical protein